MKRTYDVTIPSVISPPEIKRSKNERVIEKLLKEQSEKSKSQQIEFLQTLKEQRKEDDDKKKQLQEQREWEENQITEQRNWEERMMKWRVEQTNNLIPQLGQVFANAKVRS